MSTETQDPFSPETRENPAGFRTREFTLRIEPRVDGTPEDAPLRIAISSEAPVERYDWWSDERYVEVLDHGASAIDLSYARDGLPFLLDHDLGRQVGILENISVDADRVIRGDFRAGNHPDAAWVAADMRDGVRKKVSIGYWPGDKYEQSKDERTGAITRRYKGWTLYEASSVSVPADYSVGVGRSAQGASAPNKAEREAPAHSTETTMSVETTSERGAAPTPDTRPQELAALARNFPAHARLAEWISDNVTVDAARDEIMRKLQTAAEQRAPISTTTAVEVGAERETQKPWGSQVEFMRAVRDAATGVRTDKRLTGERAASGMGVQIGADGGFLVPEQFATGIVRYAFDTGSILSRVNRIPLSGNQYHMNLVDESSRTTGNRWGGVRGYWVGEGDTLTASRPKFRRATLDVTKKLAVLGYVSSEQLEDATATATIMDQAFGEEVAFLTEQAVFEGSGVGQPLGFLNSGALVTVLKENAQTAATVNVDNVLKMRSRLLARSRANAAWFVHLDVEPQLAKMTVGQQPVYLPANSVVGEPFGRLLGMPVLPVEHCAALGTVGDIVLADLSWYALADKASTMARSMHVRFLQDEEAFRLTYRVDGMPMLNQAITPNKGSSTLSAFIALEAR